LEQAMNAYTQSTFHGHMGVAREDITPPIGIYAKNWGAATHDVAEGVHRPLTLTVLTLQTTDEGERQEGESPGNQPPVTSHQPLILASLDLGWWRTREDEQFVREGVSEALALDPACVMLAFTHTHAGPALCREDSDKPGGHLIAPYLEQVRAALILAARRALDTACPAMLTWGQGKCTLATNRDLPDPDAPRYLSGYNADAPADDTLLVGWVVSEESGATLATLVNYACHPTTLAWQNRLLSPDYIGAMREVVEAHTNDAPCLFLLGAAGELAPREQYTDDVALPDAHGRQLGYAVLSTLAGMLPPGQHLVYKGVMESGAPLAVWKREAYITSPNPLLRKEEANEYSKQGELTAELAYLELPLKALPSVAEIEAELATCTEPFEVERLRRKRRVRLTVGEGDTASVPFWFWRVGDALLVGHPTEAYSLFQTELRQQFPEFAVVAMNVVNGHYGYLPPEHLYTEDLYPVWQSPFAAGCLESAISFSASVFRRFI
jgi:hypothetical protein